MKIQFKKIGYSLLVLFAMLVFMPFTAHAYAFNKTVDMQKIAEEKYFFNGEDMADYSDIEDYVVYHKFSVSKTALIEFMEIPTISQNHIGLIKCMGTLHFVIVTRK